MFLVHTCAPVQFGQGGEGGEGAPRSHQGQPRAGQSQGCQCALWSAQRLPALSARTSAYFPLAQGLLCSFRCVCVCVCVSVTQHIDKEYRIASYFLGCIIIFIKSL